MATYNVLLDKPRLVWFECNDQASLDSWKPVATEWQLIGKLMMTSNESQTGRVLDFISQALAVPGVTEIASGFKSSIYFSFPTDSIYDSAIWGEIATLANAVAAATGSHCSLDNESMLVSYFSNGGTSIDLGMLQDAIDDHVWPEMWIWPSPIGSSEPYRQVSYDFARGFIAGNPNTHCIEANSSGYVSGPTNPSAQFNLARTFEVDPSPYSIVYLDDVSGSQWDLADAQQTIQYVRGQASILYPGLGDINDYAAVQASYNNALPPTYNVRLPDGGDTYRVLLEG